MGLKPYHNISLPLYYNISANGITVDSNNVSNYNVNMVIIAIRNHYHVSLLLCYSYYYYNSHYYHVYVYIYYVYNSYYHSNRYDVIIVGITL